MKVLILGDIHGRTIWKDIICTEHPDKTIFLGDYVSTHNIDISSEQQIENLKDILQYKEQHRDQVILLRGNHDIQHLGYWWAECSGYDRKVGQILAGALKQPFIDNTSWIHVLNIGGLPKIVCSHAGVSLDWLQHTAKLELQDIDKINDMDLDEKFAFTPNHDDDFYGNSASQPPTWIRPYALIESLPADIIQIVGHTTVPCVTSIVEHLWLCDSLEKGSYLVIDDGIFKVKHIETYDRKTNRMA